MADATNLLSRAVLAPRCVAVSLPRKINTRGPNQCHMGYFLTRGSLYGTQLSGMGNRSHWWDFWPCSDLSRLRTWFILECRTHLCCFLGSCILSRVKPRLCPKAAGDKLQQPQDLECRMSGAGKWINFVFVPHPCQKKFAVRGETLGLGHRGAFSRIMKMWI